MRLLAAPGVGLPTDIDVERLAGRVRSVVTVSTPHHGTPLASVVTTLRGRQLLQVLSLNTVYVVHFGHLSISALLWMGSMIPRSGDLIVNSELRDELFSRLLEDFAAGRRRAVRALLRDVVRDQALMHQLTPEAMEVFIALTIFGYLKGHFTGASPVRSALQRVLIDEVAATAAFSIARAIARPRGTAPATSAGAGRARWMR